jgi:uncharacterized protein involved in exopolysaccharide biosynthesis
MLNAVSVVTDRKTKVLSIQVTLKDPVAAAVIANQLSQSLNEFNRLQINTTATDQRQFIEGRLTMSRRHLPMRNRGLNHSAPRIR